MQRRSFLLASAAAGLTPALAKAAPVPVRVKTPAGKTILRPFPDAPFPNASRTNGHDYDNVHYDAATHYSDSTIGIYIPPGYAPRGPIDFIVHFHGWNNDVRGVFARYRQREQLDASGVQAVLLVPQGPKDAPDSGDGKLELDDGAFARLLNEVAHYLQSIGAAQSADLGRIVLTAHSGGYGGAGGVLTRGGMNDRITDVILFDAAYGYYDAFANWANASPQRHFLSLFTDDTSTGNAVLMSKMQAPQPNLFVLDASAMTLAQLQTRAPTFVITTSVAHDDLMQQYDWYALFLKTTALAHG